MPTVRCVECEVHKPPDEFNERVRDSKKGKKGEKNDRCASCVSRAKIRRKEKEKEDGKAKGTGKKRARDGSEESDDEKEGGEDIGEVLTLDDFVHVVKELHQTESSIEVRARVDVSCADEVGLEERKRADRVSKVLGNFMKLHWKLVLD